MRDINLIMNDIKDLSDEVREFVERVRPLMKSLAREAAAALDAVDFDDNDSSEAENIPQDAMIVVDFLGDVESANRYLAEDTATAQRIFS